MYTTIALTIFVVEAMLPPLAPIPGIKLGLANVVTLWLLYYATWKDALCVLLMRILIASMVTGQMVSFSTACAAVCSVSWPWHCSFGCSGKSTSLLSV